MKRPYLLLLAILPILASCNKTGSFPNPFAKEDTYTRIGFGVADNEKTTRGLTPTEINLVRNTIENKSIYDPKIKCNTDAYRETRDYTLAFANEFRQGYNASNVMKREQFTIRTQADSEGGVTKKARRKISNAYNTTTQYSYGKIKETVVQDDYYYYTNNGTDEVVKDISKSVNNRSKKVINEEKYTTVTDSIAIEAEDGTPGTYKDDGDLKYLQLHQSDYIFTPDSKCGANNKNEIILVAASQVKHVNPKTEDQGFFILQDGRKFQAMDNTLTVTKLTPQDNNTWGLATYVRVYKETVITSEVIQPNVQVKKLANPITISFIEEVNHFGTKYEDISDDLPEVTP